MKGGFLIVKKSRSSAAQY